MGERGEAEDAAFLARMGMLLRGVGRRARCRVHFEHVGNLVILGGPVGQSGDTGLVLSREGRVDSGTWACWLVSAVAVGRVKGAQGTLVPREKGVAEGRTLGRSEV